MKILGIDYGRTKMGIAVGDTVLKLAEPLQVLTSSKFKVIGGKRDRKDCYWGAWWKDGRGDKRVWGRIKERNRGESGVF